MSVVNSIKIAVICLWVIVPQVASAQLSKQQESDIKEFQRIIDKSVDDSNAINAYIAWDDIIWQSNPGLDLELNLKIKSICEKAVNDQLSKKEMRFFKEKLAKSLNNLGTIYFDRGQYQNSIAAHKKGLLLRRELGNHVDIAGSLNNLANVYLGLGDYSQAVQLYSECLRICEENHNETTKAYVLNNLSIINRDQGNYRKSIEYSEQSLRIQKKIDDREGLAGSYNSLGATYQLMKNDKRAIEFFMLSKEIFSELGYEAGISTTLNNLGMSYHNLNELDKALECYQQGLEIDLRLDNLEDVAISYQNLGELFSETNRVKEAIEYSEKSFNLGKIHGFQSIQRDASFSLYELYKLTKRTDKALEMYEIYSKLKDKLNSEENKKAIIEQQYKYEYQKRALSDSIRNSNMEKVRMAELNAAELKNKQQRQRSYFLVGGLLVSFVFGGFIYNRFKVTSKQKAVIEHQKVTVDKAFSYLEEKNSEILSSITYAKRIQSTILPTRKLLDELLGEYFVYYQPKDIVAGDFYWVQKIGSKLMIAVADCTGHGVPGALVSVVCTNALNRSVKEFELSDPGAILNSTREIIVDEFAKGIEDVKDGMDIALCIIDGDLLTFAGAHNSVWIIRNNELIELKGNRQPIGKFEKASDFDSQSFKLHSDDVLYLFTDGYVDQFGGEFSKKFRSKQFQHNLLKYNKLPMLEQEDRIRTDFEQWRKDEEQIDDVCVLGIRILMDT